MSRVVCALSLSLSRRRVCKRTKCCGDRHAFAETLVFMRIPIFLDISEQGKNSFPCHQNEKFRFSFQIKKRKEKWNWIPLNIFGNVSRRFAIATNAINAWRPTVHDLLINLNELTRIIKEHFYVVQRFVQFSR